MAAGEPTTAAAENDGRERGEGDEPVAAAAPGDFKAFVGGLSWETTDEGLELYFGQFGEIVAAEVMRDRFTGQSRCFGFVSFATEDGLDVACKQHMHQIDGKEVEVKVAFRKERPLGPSEGGTGTAAAAGGASASASGTGAAKDRPEDRAGAQFNDPEKKIFVGGLLPETKEEDLVNHFSQYGDVKEAVIKYDESRRSRGFAFVTFETLEGVEKASEQTMQNLLGKRVEIKRHKKRSRLVEIQQGNMAMRAPATRAAPSGLRSATAYMCAASGWKLFEFLQSTFGAKFKYSELDGEDKDNFKHALIDINGDVVAIGQVPADSANTTCVHVYVPDVDETMKRALARGAAEVEPVQDYPFGERGCRFKDEFGNLFFVSTFTGKYNDQAIPKEQHSLPTPGRPYVPKEMSTVTPFLCVTGASKLFDQIQNIFGATKEISMEWNDGKNFYGLLRLSEDSVLEVAERAEAVLGAVHIYVPDVKAVEAKVKEMQDCKMIYPSMDHDYGETSFGFKDAFGVDWYVAQFTGNFKGDVKAKQGDMSYFRFATHPAPRTGWLPAKNGGSGEQGCSRVPAGQTLVPCLFCDEPESFATGFLTEALGADLVQRPSFPDSPIWLQHADGAVSLRKRADAAEKTHLCVFTPDARWLLDKATAAGAEVVSEVHQAQGALAARFKDPAGNLWDLEQRNGVDDCVPETNHQGNEPLYAHFRARGFAYGVTARIELASGLESLFDPLEDILGAVPFAIWKDTAGTTRAHMRIGHAALIVTRGKGTTEDQVTKLVVFVGNKLDQVATLASVREDVAIVERASDKLILRICGVLELDIVQDTGCVILDIAAERSAKKAKQA
ncbi:RNA-binding protein Musashi-like 1 [Hondaea fermentalgiana]|uniref:RNA-binding protein Musashi-like 1 n=1 Tax=Hondaea fermentalgiana TaxID=2315210 RepID=A0A2R5GBN7_9STRA|nr:RNA-binding protein Musashi-like 1 [Hondaea fermentalgiana]|eukprot:GBG25993.1 RNA-binding protein Musashi-like 1 [Hondaea fermentalgiana]